MNGLVGGPLLVGPGPLDPLKSGPDCVCVFGYCSGILVTVKQRQEFRIRLQKRARRVAERKLESFVEERNARTVRNRPVEIK